MSEVCESQLAPRLLALEASVEKLLKLLSDEISASEDRDARHLKRIQELSRLVKTLQVDTTSHGSQDAVPTLCQSCSRHLLPQGSGKSKKSKNQKNQKNSEKNASDAASGSQPNKMTPVSQHTSSSPNGNVLPNPAAGESTQGWTEVKSRAGRKVNLAPLTTEDDLWSSLTDDPPPVKKAVLYVGNLRQHLDNEALADSIRSRCKAGGEVNLSILEVKLSPMPTNPSYQWAHVTVPQSAEGILTAPNFWPGRVYCRPWRFQAAQQHRPPQQQQQPQQQNRVSIMCQQQITLPQQQQPQQQNRVSIMHQQQINSMLRAARQNPHAFHNSGACQNSASESDITLHVSSDSDWETSEAESEGQTDSEDDLGIDVAATPRGKIRSHAGRSPPTSAAKKSLQPHPHNDEA